MNCFWSSARIPSTGKGMDACMAWHSSIEMKEIWCDKHRGGRQAAFWELPCFRGKTCSSQNLYLGLTWYFFVGSVYVLYPYNHTQLAAAALSGK